MGRFKYFDLYLYLMSKIEVDSHGRIYLPKKYREKYGEKFRIVPYKKELKLIPIPENPIKDLRKRTKKIREKDKAIKELKKEAREDLEDLAGSE